MPAIAPQDVQIDQLHPGPEATIHALLDGPDAFDPKLLKRLKRPKHAVAHLKGALKRDQTMTDDEYRYVVWLALTEIGVANGVMRTLGSNGEVFR